MLAVLTTSALAFRPAVAWPAFAAHAAARPTAPTPRRLAGTPPARAPAPAHDLYAAVRAMGGVIGAGVPEHALPVAGRLTSPFGMRLHPLLGYVRLHAGQDYGAASGTPVHAAADGVVGFAGLRGGLGRYVRIDYGDGAGSGYGHLSRIAVAAGTPVLAGEVIGYVGTTGISTGPHLHYEVYRHGRAVDPRAPL